MSANENVNLALKNQYNNEFKSQLKDELKLNIMNVPSLLKMTISVGAGFAIKDTKLINNIADTISLLAGQKAVIVKAKKSVATFKVREGMPTGVKVTLRGNRMYNFLNKLISIALPRVKDFRGLSLNGFDGRGNYSFGLDEQLIFAEVAYDDIIRVHGMNINIVTSSDSDLEAKALLDKFGFPFERKDV